MCTVTYLPTAENGFILTSNRDEKIIRPAATEPTTEIISGREVSFPRDPKAGGTWIAASKDRTVCLLNGAFAKHFVNPSYKKSRGLVVLECFAYADVHEFLIKYDFGGIEPFTLLIWSEQELCELRWDFEKIHYRKLDKNLPQIWSSVTLYSDEIISKRSFWFRQWVEKFLSPNLEDIRKFHRFTGDGDTNNDLIMNREGQMLTVSMTSIVKTSDKVEIIYEDLLSQQIQSSLVD